MILFVIDNGSLEPAATRHLRAVAATLSTRSGALVHPVSWRHADQIAAAALDGQCAWTLDSFVRVMAAQGHREFLALPFFVSPQGAIGSALRRDFDRLQAEIPVSDFGLVDAAAFRQTLPAIAADRVREVIAARRLAQPPVVVVDHGGPSSASAARREELAAAMRLLLSAEIGPLASASMEGRHPPLLAEVLSHSALANRDVVVAPLFLAPGRHAGPAGDIATICHASPARCHLTGLLGTHPAAIDALASDLGRTLSNLPVPATT